ncbi:MAG: glycosyltransferase family 4 protein [Candidatus Omnitrophica bacterium]|nr:glycosyltransferase family 4 protein [Candidatus Omnitrophota bacterium]MBU4477814.1 glycosyltransferase family 4 protein [Candidatus Omnitrophota bacterium]MCG2703550.1 glycosyltransferase family 4 protein [Candidatus Omnitrophota bacterium]
MKIKVVHIVEDLKTGGLERVIADIATGLNPEKFSVQVWCLVRGGEIFEELKAKGISVEVLGMRSHRDLKFFLNLCRRLRKEKIRIVHTHGYPATTLGRIAAKCAGVPVVLAHMHSTYYNYTAKQLYVDRLLGFFTDKIICCSKAVEGFVREKEKIMAEKLTVIYNGVDTDMFPVPELRCGAGCKEFVVGCIASLFAHKGHIFLLEAAKQVVAEVSLPVRFILAGDGELRQELQEHAKRLGLKSVVEFRGTVSDIPALLSEVNAVVLPSSEREGLGLALLEAMAAGRPVIGTDIGGIPEVINPGENGLLVRPGDSEALAKAIISLISDEEKTMWMGRKARKIAAERFSKKEMLEKIELLYLKLLKKKDVVNEI